MRDVPRRLSAQDMEHYRTAAAEGLRTAIFAALREQNPDEVESYVQAANALGDYAVARSRWIKHHQEDYL